MADTDRYQGHDHGGLFIETLTAFVASDQTGEGLCGFLDPGGTWVPLIAADEARVDSLLPIAQLVANTSGQILKIVRFSSRTQIGAVEPYGG